jgi:hypothetical protein
MHDYLDEMSELTDEEFGRLCRMLLTYSITGEQLEPSGNERFYIKRIIAQEDRMQDSYSKASEARRQNGAMGGRPKKTEDNQAKPKKPSETEDNLAKPKKPNSNSSSNTSSISPNGETPPLPPSRGRKKTTQELPDPDFDAFWALYPRKKSKGEAKKAWAQLKPSREIISAIMAKLPLLVASHDWTKEGGQYVPNPATWLRAEGWEDEVKDAPRKDSFPTPAKPGEAPRVPSRAKQNAEWMQNALAEMDAEEEVKQDERV